MNLLRVNLASGANLLVPFRLFGFESPKLSSKFKYLSCHKCRFYSPTTNISQMREILSKADHVRLYSKSVFSRYFQYIKLKLKKLDDTEVKLAVLLYKTIDSIDFQEFYRFLELPDTFNSWFVILELHMWMLMSQLMNKKGTGLPLRNKIIEVMWRDIDSRLENLGQVNKKILRKQLREFNYRLPIALWVYDEGLLKNDAVLAGALWYKLFDKSCDDPLKLEVLVSYVRHQIQYLGTLNLADYQAAQEIEVFWMPFSKHIKEVMES